MVVVRIYLLVLMKSPILPNIKPNKNLAKCGKLANIPVFPKLKFNTFFMKSAVWVTKKSRPHKFPKCKSINAMNGIDENTLISGGNAFWSENMTLTTLIFNSLFSLTCNIKIQNQVRQMNSILFAVLFWYLNWDFVITEFGCFKITFFVEILPPNDSSMYSNSSLEMRGCDLGVSVINRNQSSVTTPLRIPVK